MIKQKPKLGTYRASHDRTPKYTVKQVADMMEMSAYTIRYYENVGLIPDVDRSGRKRPHVFRIHPGLAPPGSLPPHDGASH